MGAIVFSSSMKKSKLKFLVSFLRLPFLSHETLLFTMFFNQLGFLEVFGVYFFFGTLKHS